MSLDVSITGISNTPGPAGAFTEHGEGVFDFAHREGRFTLSMPQLGNRKQVVLFVGNSVYVGSPSPIDIPGSGGTRWVKLDTSMSGELAGLSPASAGASDPTQGLSYLLGVSNDVQRIGEDTVRGARTIHYSMQLDLTRAAPRLPAARRASFLRALQAIGSTTLPADVWVDAQGRIRKMETEVSYSPSIGSAAGRTLHMSETSEFYDFGVPVRVTPPPPSQVMDVSSRLEGSGSK
jgi:hypothetical protein